MRKRMLWAALAIFLGLLVVPVLIRQVIPPEQRTLRGVELADTSYTEVQFGNPAQDLSLAGMLFLPEGEGPFPAVVVINGSGNSSRGNPWYLSFTSYLQEHGVAVLLPDKRGCESSAGDWHGASFEDLATDTLAAVTYLREEHGDVISEIGVLGASQGGEIAPIVASQSPDVSFVISLVGSAVPFHEALYYEENNNLRQLGLLPGFSHAAAYCSTLYIRKSAQRDFWDAVGNHDPIPYWEKVEVPTLIMLGDRDTNVPTERTAARLNGLGKSNIDVVTFAGSGHPLEDPPGTGDHLIREDALAKMRAFIAEAMSTN